MQFELTGRTGFGSGGDLGTTARATPDGTRGDLPEPDREPGHAEGALAASAPDGERTALPRLSRAQRETVDAVLDELVERLALVAHR
ncbi:hypothetical protein PV341_09035 [Streptomyces sp. PA03-1a]|nr:hypothetical protein [Streptomyces sp. PA03-1a]MDX2813090.1 hypothetical protein [Streptomyces sp. PA03-5A]